MKYEVRIAAGAAREIAKLPDRVARQISDLIESLADDPRPRGAKKLGAIPDCYRVRSGAYRVIGLCLKHGGLEEFIWDVWRFEATYGQLEEFAAWMGRVSASMTRSRRR